VVRIDRVVTRGGDGGQTSLGDGTRVGKDAPRIEALGTVDEANAAIGLLRCAVTGAPETDAMLARIQNDLFDVGADLCVPGPDGDRLRLTEAPIDRLEAEIVALNAGLTPLTSFVLPGGTEAAARAHVARAAVRRAERDVVRLRHRDPVSGCIGFLRISADLRSCPGRPTHRARSPDATTLPQPDRIAPGGRLWCGTLLYGVLSSFRAAPSDAWPAPAA
jgi:cob(I)alamin adenosyltransferase